MDQKKVGNLAVGLGVFIFGINFVSMKFLINHIPPLTLIFLRFAIASVFLYFISKMKVFQGSQPRQIEEQDKVLVIITGFLGVVIYYFFQGMALVYLNASLAALICAMIPIFTLLTNVIIYKRKLELFLAVNFLAAILGVMLVLDISIKDLVKSSELIGCIFMLLAVFSWIAYTIKTYELQRKYDSIYLLYKQTIYGSMMLSVISLFDIAKAAAVFKQKDIIFPLAMNLLFVGVICSALGYLFYIYGMEKVGVEMASLYMNLIPAVTATASYFILDEMMTTRKILGMIIVISSLYAVGVRDWLRSKRTPSDNCLDLESDSQIEQIQGS